MGNGCWIRNLISHSMVTEMTTRIADIIVPEIFGPYTQVITREKSRIVQSGALVVDAGLSNLLNGGGNTFNEPFFNDLVNEEENISSDVGPDAVPSGINASSEIQVRLSRNQNWGVADLAADLAGADPMDAIANRVGYYWTRRLQAATIATINGVFANNALPDDAYHEQNDMVHDISGTAFQDGVTNISGSAFIDTTLTMGDDMGELTTMFIHSMVYGRLQKQNLIDFIPDSRGEILIPTYLGRQVIIDDGMPHNNGVFETWLMAAGALRLGQGSPKVPVEVGRSQLANNGGGEEILTNRVEWVIHPVGYQFIGAAVKGGPSNASTTGNLANANSWRRAFAERKQIKFAKLVTREF